MSDMGTDDKLARLELALLELTKQRAETDRKIIEIRNELNEFKAKNAKGNKTPRKKKTRRAFVTINDKSPKGNDKDANNATLTDESSAPLPQDSDMELEPPSTPAVVMDAQVDQPVGPTEVPFILVERRGKKNKLDSQEPEPASVPSTSAALSTDSPVVKKQKGENGQSSQVRSSHSKGDTDRVSVPPIVVHCSDKWPEVRQLLDSRAIRFVKAKFLMEVGVKVYPASVEDYRRMASALLGKYDHNVYPLASEKPMRVVIRGIPGGISGEVIDAELKALGYPVLNVSKLRDRSGNSSLAYVLLCKTDEGRAIYGLKTLLSLRVSVEAKRRGRHQARQCYNCQKYGHTASTCRAQSRCVKCAGDHASHLCERPKSQPADCVNCKTRNRVDTAHTASFGGCPCRPRPRENTANKPAAVYPRAPVPGAKSFPPLRQPRVSTGGGVATQAAPQSTSRPTVSDVVAGRTKASGIAPRSERRQAAPTGAADLATLLPLLQSLSVEAAKSSDATSVLALVLTKLGPVLFPSHHG